MKELKPGDIITGRVFRIEAFGAYVALENGQCGLVHISEISSRFVADIHDFLKEGDDIEVMVLDVHDEKKIDLSIKRISRNDTRSIDDKLKDFMRVSAEKINGNKNTAKRKRRDVGPHRRNS